MKDEPLSTSVMRTHILGVGAIGSLFAFHLRNALPKDKSPISLIVRRRGLKRSISQDLGTTIHVEREGHTEVAQGFRPELFNMSSNMIFSLAYDKKGNSRLPVQPQRNDASGDEYVPSDSEKVYETTPDVGAGGSKHKIDSLLITCKAPATLAAIQRILPRLHRGSTVVLCQNGMGVYDTLVQQVFPDPAKRPHFILATTSHGVWSKGPMSIVHAGMGEVHFGIVPDPTGRRNYEASLGSTPDGKLNLSDISSDPDTDPEFTTLYQTVHNLLLLTGLHTTWEPIQLLHLRLLRKLCVNCCINPLTAIMDVPNGDLLGRSSAYRLIRHICYEAADVFQAQARGELAAAEEAMQDGASALSPPDAALAAVHLAPRALEEETIRIAQMTAKNYSSMLQDMKSGKPPEIDYMNGYLCTMGEKWGVPTPLNETMVSLVKLRQSLPKPPELPGVMKWWDPMGSWPKEAQPKRQTHTQPRPRL